MPAGPPHRRRFHTNIPFAIIYALLVIFFMVVIFAALVPLDSFFDLINVTVDNYPHMPSVATYMLAKLLIVGIALLGFLICLLIEVCCSYLQLVKISVRVSLAVCRSVCTL